MVNALAIEKLMTLWVGKENPHIIALSPSGKATDFDSVTHQFESDKRSKVYKGLCV